MWNNALNKSDWEWIAVGRLLELYRVGKIGLVRSAVVARELGNTKNGAKRGALLKGYNALEKIEFDEKVHCPNPIVEVSVLVPLFIFIKTHQILQGIKRCGYSRCYRRWLALSY